MSEVGIIRRRNLFKVHACPKVEKACLWSGTKNKYNPPPFLKAEGDSVPSLGRLIYFPTALMEVA